jgi:hypothetical protein
MVRNVYLKSISTGREKLDHWWRGKVRREEGNKRGEAEMGYV